MITRRIDSEFLIGIGGVITCLITALVGLWEFTIASEEFAKFVPYPIAKFSVLAGQFLFASEHARNAASYWLYLTLWILHISVFAVAYWIRVHPRVRRSAAADAVLLLVQLGAALSGHQPLLYLFAFELPFVMPRRKAAGWLAAGLMLSAAVDASFMHSRSDDLSSSLYEIGMNLGYLAIYESMHFTVGLLAARERSGRRKLEKAHAELTSANAELIATQMLLVDTVRAAERMRIARDLHDSLGHHLMAQNLHLELAIRKCQTVALSPIKAARELARSLLSEVRKVVSAERKDESVNLRRILETYCSGTPSPRIALFIEEELAVISPAVANAIFQNVQETVGDAVRHAGAVSLRISLTREDNGIALRVTDEGALTEDAGAHNAPGGRFDQVNSEGSRFDIRVWLPQPKRSLI